MAKYVVEDIKTSSYEKNYMIPLVNIIPAVVWSIPFHQKMFPDVSWWMTFGLCAAFVVLFCILSYMPILSVVPCVAGAMMFIGLIWVFADYIGNDIVRIIVKVVIVAFFGFMELAVFANALVPWLDNKKGKKPRVYRVEE